MKLRPVSEEGRRRLLEEERRADELKRKRLARMEWMGTATVWITGASVVIWVIVLLLRIGTVVAERL